MAYNTSYSREPDERSIPGSRISSVSDFSSPDLYDPAVQDFQHFSSPPTSPPIRQNPVHQLRSQEALDAGRIRRSATWGDPMDPSRPSDSSTRTPEPFQTGSGQYIPPAANRTMFPWRQTDSYEPLTPVDPPARASTGFGSFRSNRASVRGLLSRHQSIPENEEINMHLMSNASKSEHGGTSYRPGGSRNISDEHADPIGVDISIFTGPGTSLDEPTVLRYRRLEQMGELTGGLGTGLQPELRFQSKDLLATAPPASPLEMSRRLSRRGGAPARSSSLRDLGQREANRRGKIIEVVDEEATDESDRVDLSLYAGGTAPPVGSNMSNNQQSTFHLPKVVTFYPQPNWKPHSMRWPYITFLIVVSMALAAAQELLYQRSLYKSRLVPPSGLFEFTNAEALSTWDYFTFKYLPTIIAVSYGVLWQVNEYEVKRLEPFYRLSMEGGALAAESINVDYITVFNVFRPFKALRYRHYAVAVSSFATIFAISLVPTLQTASVILMPDRETRFNNPTGPKYIQIHPIWSRILTGVLSVVAILGIILLILLQRRRSGLVGDVRGIAGLAAMATKSHVLMDFKDLDTVPPQDIHKKLKTQRYSLRNSSLISEEVVTVSREDRDKYDRFRLTANPHPLMLRLSAGLPFIGSMVLVTAFIPVIIFTPANIVLDRANWLITALAVTVKVGYQTLEQDARLMEPFYRLSCRHAHPKVLTLDYTTMAIGYMPIRAAINGDYLIALVGFGSVLAEVLTVCVTSLAGVGPSVVGDIKSLKSLNPSDATSETPTSFLVSFGLSLFILVYMITTASFVYILRHHPFLPRQPSTISSVLAYIHQSKMLYDFVAVPPEPQERERDRPAPPRRTSTNDTTSSDDNASPTRPPARLRHAPELRAAETEHDQDVLVQRLADMGKTYGLGWFTGRDGENHCGVDQEELIRSYTHKAGDDARKATMPWLGWDYE